MKVSLPCKTTEPSFQESPSERLIIRDSFVGKVLRSLCSQTLKLLSAFCILIFCLFLLPFVPHFLIFARFKFRSDLRYFIRKFAATKNRPECHPEIYEKFIKKAQHNADHFWSFKWESYLD